MNNTLIIHNQLILPYFSVLDVAVEEAMKG